MLTLALFCICVLLPVAITTPRDINHVLDINRPVRAVQTQAAVSGSRLSALLKAGYKDALCGLQTRLNAEKVEAQIPIQGSSPLFCDGVPPIAKFHHHSAVAHPDGHTSSQALQPKDISMAKRAPVNAVIALDTEGYVDETPAMADAFDGSHDLYYETQRRQQAERRAYFRRELAAVLERSEWLKESGA